MKDVEEYPDFCLDHSLFGFMIEDEVVEKKVIHFSEDEDDEEDDEDEENIEEFKVCTQ